MESRSPRLFASPVFDDASVVVGGGAGLSARGSAEAALRFLSDASAALAESLSYETTLERIASISVPRFADWCFIDLLQDDGELRRVELAHLPTASRIGDELRRVSLGRPIEPTHPAARALEQCRVVLIEDARDLDGAACPEDARFLATLGIRSLLCAPLVARGRTLGVLTFAVCHLRRPYSSAEIATAEQLAYRAALSIDNARLYEQAQQQTASAQAASRTKDEFLAMLGHELRNPLAPIVTALELMRLRGGDHLVAERAVIDRQVKHLVRLVDDLLDVSRITRGKVQLRPRIVELAKIVGDAVERAAPLFEERRQTLIVDVAREGLAVQVDEQRLSQVVSNLLTNAAKYTPACGRIEVRARREAGRIRFEVRDSGIGIAKELLPRVFDMFVQSEQSIDRADGGLGLGLTIVRNLVELHGGRVGVASDGPGKGSVFTFWLPLATGPVEHASPPQGASEAATRALESQTIRVLIVDDNHDLATTTAEFLAEMGCLVHVAHDGPQALAAAAEFCPDVALLDIGLPVMDGYELAARMRAGGGAPPALVAVTGYGQSTDRERSRNAGFDEHLVKPVDLDTLASVVARLGRRDAPQL